MYESLKSRILSPWRFTRWLYLVMGVTIVIQGFYAHQTMGIALGGYFAAMAIFGFGCAGGNCNVPVNPEKYKNTEVDYEEIK